MASSISSSLVLLVLLSLLSISLSLSAPSPLRFRNLHPHTADHPLLSADVEWNITILHRPWLFSAPVSFRALNRTFSSHDDSLTVTGVAQSRGLDSIGLYDRITLTWAANQALLEPDATLTWETSFRVYVLDAMGARGAIVFEQVWVTGASGTSMGSKDGVLSAFPSFAVGGPNVEPQGYLQWAGEFAFEATHVGSWYGNGSLPHLDAEGVRSGPVVIFDAKAQLATMLAPLTSFMSASVVQEGGVVNVGVLGSMEAVPPGWSLETILYWDNEGVNLCVERWGDLMLSKYGKVRSDAYDEFTVKYLGYNTDNGAYYYYNTEPGKLYDQTLYDVQAYWESLDLPFRFIWLDSWFYPKAENGGTKNWTAMPSVFPDGLPAFHERLRLPLIAHNRWWSAVTDYAKANGGQYDWVVEPKTSGWAVPVDQTFWNDLFFNASAWGLRVYQQDWLYNEFETVIALTTQLDLGRQWLMQMGQGAANAGISIMYCMPSPRHLLQSIEIPAVKQVRASDDYIPGNTQWHNWQVAYTSLLEWSIGLAPSKDDFWTTQYQNGSIYPGGNEPDPLLQSMIATFSTGQVTPSDGIGYMSPAVVRRSIRLDGLILKPDRPAIFPDSEYADRAFSAAPNEDYIAVTWSVHTDLAWLYVIVVDTDANSDPRPHLLGDLLPASVLPAAIARGGEHWIARYTKDSLVPKSVEMVSLTSELDLTPPLGSWALAMSGPALSSPAWNTTIAVLGEGTKWVAMSAQRVRDVRLDLDYIQLGLMGSGGEPVSIVWVWKDSNGTIKPTVQGGCILAQTNTATLRIPFKDPTTWSCGEGTVLPPPSPQADHQTGETMWAVTE